MKMNTRSVALLSSVAAFGLSLAGCSSGSSNPLAPIQAAQAKNAGNFSNTVFLGDSLTAGYQSGSLLDTQQIHGWAPLVATQANFSIVQPLIAYPGAQEAALHGLSDNFRVAQRLAQDRQSI